MMGSRGSGAAEAGGDEGAQLGEGGPVEALHDAGDAGGMPKRR
jgi:hypothetical protein